MLARDRQSGLRPRFARVLGRQIAAGQPGTVQRRNPLQRTGSRYRCRPAGEHEAFPHVHLLVVGLPDRTDHRPDSQPYATAGPGDQFPGASLERADRASALARTMSGSRGSGESASSHGRSLRTLRRPIRIRFITDLPRAIDHARAQVGHVVSLADAGIPGLPLVSMMSPCQLPGHRPNGRHVRSAVVFPNQADRRADSLDPVGAGTSSSSWRWRRT